MHCCTLLAYARTLWLIMPVIGVELPWWPMVSSIGSQNFDYVVQLLIGNK